MEWESWLEKVNTSSDGTDFKRSNIDDSLLLDTDKPKKIVPLRMDDDKGGAFDDSGFYNKSWEIWLEKNNNSDKDHSNTHDEEWDGKFSSSNIKNEVKDEKSTSEEEPLDELTDGKLEEVEKLKAWQIFLKGVGGIEEDLPHPEGEIAGKKDMHSLTGRYQNPIKHKKGHGKGTPQQVTIDGVKTTIPREQAIQGTKKTPTSRKGAYQDTKGTKHMSHDDHIASATRVAKDPDMAQFMTDVAPKEQLGSGTDKEVKTQEQLDKEFYERNQPEPKGSNPNRVLARRKRKSWEVWLEKGRWDNDKKENKFVDSLQAIGAMGNEEFDRPVEMTGEEMEGQVNSDKKLGGKTTYKAPNITNEPVKIPKKKVPVKDVDNRLNVLEAHKLKSWENWLIKMQGAGDARFGNPHLTGLDQEPVDNKEDEANILPEKESKNNKKEEKQDKTEQKEKDSNKPYKA